MAENKIQVEVAYATAMRQKIMVCSIPEGLTLEQAIHASGILMEFPEIDLAKQKVGIFGKVKPLATLVTAGERIEIYRPLKIDPKEARRKRAKA